MARKRMVTRSFYTTKVKAIVFNNETNNTGEIEEILAGQYKNNDLVLKALKGRYSADEKLIPVKVIEVTEDSALYGIEEDEFLKHAKKLKNRNNEVSEEDEDDTESIEE